MKTRWATIGVAALLLTACVPVAVQGQVPGVVIDPVDPYYYSPAYCTGCWYGQWGGRMGYHRGGGRPWESPHIESHHYAQDAYDNSMRVDPTAPVQGSTSQAQPAASGGLFGDIRKSVSDVINPIQAKLKESATNPLLQMGLGLLASGYDRSVNPYLAMQKGLGAIPGAGLTQAQGNKAQTDASNEAATLAAIKALIASGAIPGMAQQGGARAPASASGLATVIPRPY